MLPAETHQRLLEIAEELPYPTVFGGFLRDAILGVPYKDVDIAYPANVIALEKLGFDLNPSLMDDKDYDHDRIHAIWTRDDLNVIEVADSTHPQAMNQYCDIGLCKVAWTPVEGLFVSAEFLKDMHSRTLTVYRRGWGEEGVRAHMDRLKLKFPDYKEVWDHEPHT